MTISNNLEKRIEYLKKIRILKINGTHIETIELRTNLGILMEKLKKNDETDLDNENIEMILKEIFEIINDDQIEDIEPLVEQYKMYRLIVKNRNIEIEKYNSKRIRKFLCFLKKDKISNLSNENRNLWGSSRQMLFGKIVVDELNKEYKMNMHPVFGCLLSPTGGITGPGNFFLFRHIVNFPIIMHTVVHDAAGYLLLHHNLGPGYNYLDKYTCLPMLSPLNFIFGGIRFWTNLLKEEIK